MQIGIIGINHKSATLELREKLALASIKHFKAFHLHNNLSYVLLTTCNRMEIYFSSCDLAGTHTYLLNVLREDIVCEFEHTVYSYFGSDCFFHLAKVTAGMDSAILGETEIQGQVKQAYEASQSVFLHPDLHFLFQKSLKIGKNIRSQIHLKVPHNTLEEAILRRGKSILGDLTKKKILFVGVSEINQKILKRFALAGLQGMTLCNRTFEKALNVSKKHSMQVLPWHELSECTHDYDMIICGTKAPHYLLEKEQFDTSEKKLTLLIDLSVPRNIDPKVASQEGVILLNIDQIHKNGENLSPFVRLENALIAKEVEKQMALFAKRESFYLNSFVS